MPDFAITLAEQPAIPLAVVRRRATRAELSRLVPECCGLVWSAVRAQHARGGRHVAVYLDGAINLEVGVELAGPFTEQGDVVRSTTPGGRCASTMHLGPYSSLGRAHEAVLQWCRDHGHRLVGPSWEVYGHWQESWNRDPSQIRTDVFYQIA